MKTANCVPSDRSSKQPPRGYCFNPKCRENSESSENGRHEFDVTGDTIRCDKCGRSEPPTVGLLVLIHLLVFDPQGPVVGSRGDRYRFACDQHRCHLATPTNLEAATGDIGSANCPGCLKALHDDDLKHAAKQQAKPAVMKTVTQETK